MALINVLTNKLFQDKCVKISFTLDLTNLLDGLLQTLETSKKITLKESMDIILEEFGNAAVKNTLTLQTSKTSFTELVNVPIRKSLKHSGGKKKTKRIHQIKKRYKMKTKHNKNKYNQFGGNTTLFMVMFIIFFVIRQLAFGQLIMKPPEYKTYIDIIEKGIKIQGPGSFARNTWGSCFPDVLKNIGLVENEEIARKTRYAQFGFISNKNAGFFNTQKQSVEQSLVNVEIKLYTVPEKDLLGIDFKDNNEKASYIESLIYLGFNELFPDLEPNSYVVLGFCVPSHIVNIHFHLDKFRHLSAKIFNFNNENPFSIVSYILPLLNDNFFFQLLMSSSQSLKNVQNLPSREKVERTDFGIGRRLLPFLKEKPYYDKLSKQFYKNFDPSNLNDISKLRIDFEGLVSNYFLTINENGDSKRNLHFEHLLNTFNPETQFNRTTPKIYATNKETKLPFPENIEKKMFQLRDNKNASDDAKFDEECKLLGKQALGAIAFVLAYAMIKKKYETFQLKQKVEEPKSLFKIEREADQAYLKKLEQEHEEWTVQHRRKAEEERAQLIAQFEKDLNTSK
jgi:hypothetical protein